MTIYNNENAKFKQLIDKSQYRKARQAWYDYWAGYIIAQNHQYVTAKKTVKFLVTSKEEDHLLLLRHIAYGSMYRTERNGVERFHRRVTGLPPFNISRHYLRGWFDAKGSFDKHHRVIINSTDIDPFIDAYEQVFKRGCPKPKRIGKTSERITFGAKEANHFLTNISTNSPKNQMKWYLINDYLDFSSKHYLTDPPEYNYIKHNDDGDPL